MSDFLDKRDRRVLRRLFAGNSSWETIPPHRREKLERHAAALNLTVAELAKKETSEFVEALTGSPDPL